LKKLYGVIAVVVIVVLAVAAYFSSSSNVDPRAVKHETNRWAVIEDMNGDKMAVETVWNETWAVLVEMRQNGSRLWVGSFVESYGNKWGFRLDPGNLTVAQVAEEDLQVTMRYVSASLNGWMGRFVYISAKVVDVNSP
jgi:hypothetical protein